MSTLPNQISLEEAKHLTENYRNFPVGQLGQLLSGTKAELFDAESIKEVTNQTGCVSVRIYYGVKMNPTPQFCLVIVGVDALGKDITAGIILDDGRYCPPDCDSGSELN